MLPRSWKKLFNSGVKIPKKMRLCIECKIKTLCTTCDKQVNENKEFETKLDLLKREAPNDFGHMLLYYKMKFSTFCTKSSNIYSCFLLFVIYTLAIFLNISKVYVFNLRSIKRQQNEHLTCILLNVLTIVTCN